MRILVTRCSIRYEGRLVTTLESGDRVVLFKDDGSVVVHAVQGAKPINYMPGPTSVTEDGRTLTITRTATGETLVIDVEEAHADSAWELEDSAKLVREGREKDIQATIFGTPHAIDQCGILNELDSAAALTRAKKTVADLAQVLSETADESGAARPGDS